MTIAKKPWIADFVALGALWGSSFLFMRFSALEFGAVATAAGRVAIAAAFLLPIVMIKGKLGELKTHWKGHEPCGMITPLDPRSSTCKAPALPLTPSMVLIPALLSMGKVPKGSEHRSINSA